jgi:zinc transporter, ZIP family
MVYLVLLRSSVATLVAWIGISAGALIGGEVKGRLSLLVNASLGALLAVTLFDILPDANEFLTLPVFIVAVGSGCVAFWLMAKYIGPICPACALSSHRAAPTARIAGTVVLLIVALGLHSFMDGAAVVIGDRIAGGDNAAVFFAVSLHKFPEGMALVLVLVGAGLRRKSALIWSLGIEATTEIGALVGLLMIHTMPLVALGIIFANIGGGFLYLIATAFKSQIGNFVGDDLSRSKSLPFITAGGGFCIAAATITMSQMLTH